MNKRIACCSLLFVWVLLGGCSLATPISSTLPVNDPVPASTFTAPPPTSTSTPGLAQSPTPTLLPSPSPTETPSIFNPAEVIAPENAARLAVLKQVLDCSLSDMVFSADGRQIYIACPPVVYVYDVETLTRRVFYSDNDNIFWSLLALSPDGAHLLISYDFNWILVNAATGQKQQTFDFSKQWPSQGSVFETTLLNWSGDGSVIAMGSIAYRSAGSLQCLPCEHIADRLDYYNAENGSFIHSETKTGWTITSDQMVDTGIINVINITGLAASPDGRLFAASRRSSQKPDSIILYDAHSGAELRKLPTTNYYSSVVFSPDGKTLAFGNYFGEITFWDLAANSEIRMVTDTSGPVQILKNSPDGRLLYDVSQNGWLSLWDASTGDLLQQLDPQGNSPGFSYDNLMAVSPSGKMLAFGTESGRIIFLGIP